MSDKLAFSLKRGCIDNVYTLNEIVPGKLRKHMHSF